MYRILLIFIFILNYPSGAIERPEFEKIVDFVNCDLTNLYISSLTGEKLNYDKIKELLNGNSLENPLSFNELSKLLKSNNFEGTEKTLSVVIDNRKTKFDARYSTGELINTVLDNSDLSEKYRKALDIRSNQLKEIILNHYASKEKVNTGNNTPKIETGITELSDRVFKIEQSIGKIKPFPLWAILGIIVLSILGLLAGSFFAFKPLLREYIIKTTLQSKRINEHFSSVCSAQKNTDRGKKPEIPSDDLITDEKEIDLIADRVLLKLQSGEAANKKDIQANRKTPIQDKSKASEILYCTEPRDGVSFDSKNLSERFIETESVFVFHLKNSNTAEFRVITDSDTMGRAIKYKKELLDTACDSLNSSINTKRVITTEPGIAARQGDRWIIKSKARIKFE